MCFSIPLKITTISGNFAFLETGTKVKLDKNMKVHTGDYVRISGIMIVDCLSKKDGDSIRKLITELNTNYVE